VIVRVSISCRVERGVGEEEVPGVVTQKVSRANKASSPAWVQNWPGRLNRQWACRQVASTGPLPIGSPARGAAR